MSHVRKNSGIHNGFWSANFRLPKNHKTLCQIWCCFPSLFSESRCYQLIHLISFSACFTNHLQLCNHSCKCSFPRCFFLHRHRPLVAQDGCILKNSELSSLGKHWLIHRWLQVWLLCFRSYSATRHSAAHFLHCWIGEVSYRCHAAQFPRRAPLDTAIFGLWQLPEPQLVEGIWRHPLVVSSARQKRDCFAEYSAKLCHARECACKYAVKLYNGGHENGRSKFSHL